MQVEVTSREKLLELLAQLPAAAVIFTGPHCGICHAVTPRLEELLAKHFPRLTFLRVDIERIPDAAAHYQVHAIPSLLFFFEGRESQRFVRAFGIEEVRAAIERPYRLLFE